MRRHGCERRSVRPRALTVRDQQDGKPRTPDDLFGDAARLAPRKVAHLARRHRDEVAAQVERRAENLLDRLTADYVCGRLNTERLELLDMAADVPFVRSPDRLWRRRAWYQCVGVANPLCDWPV